MKLFARPLMPGVTASVLLTALLWPVVAPAKTPDKIDAIKREARIVADVMKSVLRSELRNGLRVTGVTAEYLAQQGVLVSVKLNTPWLSLNDSQTGIAINGRIDLEEIPTMVENILAELQIDITPYEPEALEALRALREEQRELRLEQRQIRSKLRQRRRALVRADGEDERAAAARDIAKLETELAAVDAQYDDLARDIDSQYKELRDYRGGPSAPRPPAPPPNLDSLIARTACDYGGTLKALHADDYLTIALRRDESTHYYAFKMDDIYGCSRGDISAERLLNVSYQYDS